MCAVTKMCWVSVQGCAQDCYIKGLHLSYTIFKELVCDSGIRSYYRIQFKVKISADRDKRQDCPGQLMGEMKHTITYQGSF